MTAAIIRTAIEAEFARSPAPPTTDDIAAAVLRAAADQVVLKCPEPKWTSGAEQARWFACNDVRDHILAIAAELEGAQVTGSTH